MSENHVQSTQLIQDIVMGVSDGLTVPFALAAGLSSALSDNHLIITAGMAEIIAGSIAMGLGGYMSGQTEQEHYESELKREYYEVENCYEQEKQEIRDIFADYGLSPSTQNLIADELAQDKDNWVHVMMKLELGLEKPDAKRATKSGLTIGISYIIGGLIPLSPYFLTATPLQGMKWSCIITLLSLFVFGYFKSQVTGQPLFRGALKVTLIGAIAAAAAYFIAKLFG